MARRSMDRQCDSTIEDAFRTCSQPCRICNNAFSFSFSLSLAESSEEVLLEKMDEEVGPEKMEVEGAEKLAAEEISTVGEEEARKEEEEEEERTAVAFSASTNI